nr:MAG TPA: hypothetical protein [Caudoviricetes sp.]
MRKFDFCKRCAIHLGKSQFNKLACITCKRKKGAYYPSAFIKARKPEQQ